MAATAMTSSVTTDAPSSTSPTTTNTSPSSIPAPSLPISMPTTTTTSTTSSPSTAHLSLEERFPFLREQTGRRRSRQLLSPEQTNVLLGILRQTRFPSTAVREQAAKELGISPRKVQVFFQNKRQGLRKKMLNAAQDLVDLANSEDTSHDALPTKTPAGAQLQARQRRAMTLGGRDAPGARMSSPVTKETSSAAAESRTYDAWRRGGVADDDDGMDVDGEESEDGSPDEGEEDTHGDVGEEPQTPTPARLAAAMQGRPLAAITTTPHVGAAQRQRAASDAAYVQQRGASHAIPTRPQHSPIQQQQQQQQQRPQAHPYARPSPRSATLLPPLQVPRNNGHAGTTTTTTTPGALTSSASPRRATFSFAAPPASRTMPAPPPMTRSLPMVACTTTRSPAPHVGTTTSPPGPVVLGLSNMAPRHPPLQHQHQQQARPHDAARHHQRSISLAAYPMMTGAGPQHQHQHHMSRTPLQPLAPQPQPQPIPRQQHHHSPIQTQPARPTSLRRHASYGHSDAHAQQPTAAPVASLPFMQWRSGDQSYASTGMTMDGNGSMTTTTTTTTHPSSGTGSSDMDLAWTPSSTRDDGLASKEGQRVISPRHAHAVATPWRRMHAPLPHQWMQHAHSTAHANAGAIGGRARGLSMTRKPVCLAPILDLSLDVPLDVERLAVGSRSPENARIRLGEEADDGEVSMTLPPLRLGESLRRRREGSLGGKRRRRGAQAKGDEEVASDEDDEADEDDAPLSKTCARETAQQQQPTTLPSVAELTRTLGLLPWTTTKGRPVKQDVGREAAVASATMSA